MFIFRRNLLDDGATLSPPMQMSPYGLLSPSLYYGSPDLHIPVLPRLLSPASPVYGPSPDMISIHSPYFEAYTSLVTGSSPPQQPHTNQPITSNAALSSATPIVVMDQSDSDSASTTNLSVTSHDLAIGMLDQAINSYEVPLSPGRSSDAGMRSLSPSSDPRSRDLLARSVAEAFIAKLVHNSGAFLCMFL